MTHTVTSVSLGNQFQFGTNEALELLRVYAWSENPDGHPHPPATYVGTFQSGWGIYRQGNNATVTVTVPAPNNQAIFWRYAIISGRIGLYGFANRFVRVRIDSATVYVDTSIGRNAWFTRTARLGTTGSTVHVDVNSSYTSNAAQSEQIISQVVLLAAPTTVQKLYRWGYRGAYHGLSVPSPATYSAHNASANNGIRSAGASNFVEVVVPFSAAKTFTHIRVLASFNSPADSVVEIRVDNSVVYTGSGNGWHEYTSAAQGQTVTFYIRDASNTTSAFSRFEEAEILEFFSPTATLGPAGFGDTASLGTHTTYATAQGVSAGDQAQLGNMYLLPNAIFPPSLGDVSALGVHVTIASVRVDTFGDAVAFGRVARIERLLFASGVDWGALETHRVQPRMQMGGEDFSALGNPYLVVIAQLSGDDWAVLGVISIPEQKLLLPSLGVVSTLGNHAAIGRARLTGAHWATFGAHHLFITAYFTGQDWASLGIVSIPVKAIVPSLDDQSSVSQPLPINVRAYQEGVAWLSIGLHNTNLTAYMPEGDDWAALGLHRRYIHLGLPPSLGDTSALGEHRFVGLLYHTGENWHLLGVDSFVVPLTYKVYQDGDDWVAFGTFITDAVAYVYGEDWWVAGAHRRYIHVVNVVGREWTDIGGAMLTHQIIVPEADWAQLGNHRRYVPTQALPSLGDLWEYGGHASKVIAFTHGQDWAAYGSIPRRKDLLYQPPSTNYGRVGLSFSARPIRASRMVPDKIDIFCDLITDFQMWLGNFTGYYWNSNLRSRPPQQAVESAKERARRRRKQRRKKLAFLRSLYEEGAPKKKPEEALDKVWPRRPPLLWGICYQDHSYCTAVYSFIRLWFEQAQINGLSDYEEVLADKFESMGFLSLVFAKLFQWFLTPEVKAAMNDSLAKRIACYWVNKYPAAAMILPENFYDAPVGFIGDTIFEDVVVDWLIKDINDDINLFLAFIDLWRNIYESPYRECTCNHSYQNRQVFFAPGPGGGYRYFATKRDAAFVVGINSGHHWHEPMMWYSIDSTLSPMERNIVRLIVRPMPGEGIGHLRIRAFLPHHLPLPMHVSPVGGHVIFSAPMPLDGVDIAPMVPPDTRYIYFDHRIGNFRGRLEIEILANVNPCPVATVFGPQIMGYVCNPLAHQVWHPPAAPPPLLLPPNQ